MPLWSNEDWRARIARIGSCWCALGRTFNTRFTRCRGKSQRDLSTHQAATMVIMMILFIAANMGLYITRERHKNLICGFLFGETITELHIIRFGLLLSLFVPVLKFVVQMVCGRLPRKLNLSLKQFFIDLNDSLWFIGSVIRTFIVSPVLFVVNFTTGNICNVLGKLSNHLTKLIGDRLSNGFLMKSLVVVIIVTIQLLVSVMVARAIIFFLLVISGDIERSRGPGNMDYTITKVLLVELETTAVQASLLLRCGDVESNPGPLTREDIQKVENSTSLTEDHLRDVFREVVTIKFTYYHLGLELGLSPGELDPMRMTATYSIDQALSDMLLVWLRQRYNIGIHGAPTWQRLVEAVNSPSGGNNPSLAIIIANKHLVNGVAPIVNIPHGQDNYQSPHPSNNFPPPVHMLMHNQPSLSPHLHNQGYSVIPPNQAYTWPHWRGSFSQLSNNVMAPTMYACAQTQPLYMQGAPPIQFSPSRWTPYPRQSQDRGFESVPPPKRYKPDPPMGQIALSTSILQGIKHCRQKLVNFYLAQEHVHAMDEWPPLKAVDFVTLALVKQNKQASHINLQTIQENVEAVYGQKINVCLNDLFKNIGKRALVLFEGRPGSGKTTLMAKISCDWGRKKILKSKLVLLVRLRHLSKAGEIYLHDLLRVVCPAFTPDDVQGLSSYIEGRLGEGVVFLLDGFDEYAPGASDDNYISKLILKMVYSQSIVILSSRPAAAQRFRHRTTLWVEVVGFMKEQVLQYINCYFEDNEKKSSSLIQHLKEHHNLMNLCYLPLHCAMLVFLYKMDATLPETETEFYRDFTLSLIFRDHVKDTKLQPMLKLKSFDCLSNEKKEALIRVCKLAFEATVARRQVFEESEVHGICFKDSSENTSESLGLVVVDRYFAKSGVDETYTFLHLTLQEYLAALFVSRLSESEQISTMATLFYHQHLFVTSRFLFGILDYSKENTIKLFEQMLGATEHHLLHHIQCACESHSASACTDVVNFHDKNLSFRSINNASDIFCITHVLKTVEYDAIELSFSECNFDINDAVSLLQGVGDRQLSLTIKQGKAAQSMLNALSDITVSGLVELVVYYTKLNIAVGGKYLTMETNHLQHCTNLQKLDLQGIDVSNSGVEEAFKFWPNLVKLKLDQCHCHMTSVAKVMEEGLQHMTKAHHTTDQTLEITLKDCDFNKEAVVGLLQAVGDRRLSLTITYEYMDIDVAKPLVDALCLFTLPGLIELDLTYVADVVYLTMRPNNLKHSTNLQKLNLFRLDISNSGLEKALKHWPNLVELKLDHCHFHVSSVAEVLGEGLQHMTKAHHTTDQTLEITLDGCDFYEEAAVGLLQAVGDRRLSLTITYEDIGIDAQPLVDALCLVTLPGLIELNVTYLENDYRTMGPNNLKHSTNLQKLNLFRLDVSNSGLEKAVKHWPNLVELILDNCDCRVTSVAEVLGEGLQHMTKAHHTTDQTLEITLEDCVFNKEAALCFLQAVGDRRLSLTITNENMVIDDAQPLVDALCLVTLPGLIELNLDGNSIGDDGLHALSLPIKNYCKELKELRLLGTQLTDRSITCLTEWIKVLNNLEKLNLRWTHFSEGGVKQIEEAVSERNTREGVAKLELDISDQEPLSP